MPDTWQNLAIAVAGRLEFERKCDRGSLLDEAAVVRFVAEYFQANWKGKIRVNDPHEDIAGKYVDLVGTSPNSPKLSLALEAKWLKPEAGVREWLKEVAVDVFRLQHMTTNMIQGAERAVLVAGTRRMLVDELASRTVQAGAGKPRVLAAVHILPLKAEQTWKKFEVRNVNADVRRWLRTCHTKLGVDLPSSYDARLAGHYRSWKGEDSVEVFVWLTRRPKGWGSFDPNEAWPE